MGVIRTYGFNSIKEVAEGGTEREALDISRSGHLVTGSLFPELICKADVKIPGVY